MRIIVIILIILTGHSVKGQIALEIGMNGNYRIFTNESYDPGKNGAALALTLLKELEGPGHIRGGMELGAAGVTNYFAFSGAYGFSAPLKWKNTSFSMDIFTKHGSGIYLNGLLYTWGIGDSFSLSYHFQTKGTASLFLAFTYYSYPAYKKYSPIYSFLDVNVGLRYTFGTMAGDD